MKSVRQRRPDDDQGVSAGHAVNTMVQIGFVPFQDNVAVPIQFNQDVSPVRHEIPAVIGLLKQAPPGKQSPPGRQVGVSGTEPGHMPGMDNRSIRTKQIGILPPVGHDNRVPPETSFIRVQQSGFPTW